MKKALTVSVIIPAYNEEGYIARCLNALLNQTVTPDEIIVVDNNSTDETYAIAESYRRHGVTLVSEPTQGLYAARATGMNMAKGDILCRIDADTEVDSHWVATVQEYMTDPSIQLATGPLGYYDFIAPKTSRNLEDFFLRIALGLGYGFAFGANMAIRRSAWQKLNDTLCDDRTIMEDIDLVIHAQDFDIRPHYIPTFTAMVSSRRMADSPSAFWRYITGHTRTMKKHGTTSIGARYSVAGFMGTYLLLKPLHMFFDPSDRRFRLSYFLAPSSARPDPMMMNEQKPQLRPRTLYNED